MLIAVAGMVGTGKTTLTRALARYFGFAMALESVGGEAEGGEANPWLRPYYGEADGMRRYGLQLQLHFLATRLESLRRMRGEGGDWILDRTWYEDGEIFARGLYEQGLMGPMEFDLYSRLYTELAHSPAARPPRLLIYLHGPLEAVVARIRARGREAEQDADEAYWHGLHDRYRRWIGGFRHCPVLPLDIREYDLIADPGAVEAVAARVRLKLGKDLERTGQQYRLTV
jgi:deoxyadenosine/deoxycytidine kinase